MKLKRSIKIIDKKSKEKSNLESYRKISGLEFDILEIDEAQKIYPAYHGENPDFIIKYKNEYIGIDLFLLCLDQSPFPINYGGKKYVNQMQRNKEHSNHFNTIEDAEANLRKRRENPRLFPLKMQDDLSNILEQRISKKLKVSENYAPPKNWLLGFGDEDFNIKMIKSIYEDKLEDHINFIIKKHIANSEKIEKVVLVDLWGPDYTILESRA